jgi:hypothetical protein
LLLEGLTVLRIGGITIEYMEIFLYNLPNSPGRDVDLIFLWDGFYGNFAA